MDLYYTPGSAPCRLVLLVAAALDIQLNLKELNLQAGEHMTTEFLELNPQHTVPTLVDDGFALWESHAICRYLIRKYNNRELYPEDIQIRALIDQRLDFDLGTLYPRFRNFFYPQVFAGKPANESLFRNLKESLDIFNSFLKGHKYAVGDTLTLADLSLVATVSTLEAAAVSLESYPRVERWFELVKSTAPAYEEANEKGLIKFKALVANFKAKTEL
ncbi:glutathione S-transferase 1-like [Cydia pomonella]|uniref:glutathione S-transferase 1-like n=1 Tax=Cydia pomonella TaxID=82600 RepID=UPI002ADE4AAC|nr:glutathione S-transferase 1-like [Cydia pomonella]XP_061705123.1 glutathione S-transferase 1-like [Cydia pomonella]XP_061705124.1 glutathione S-transferase 1-like [Cydia pomonella]XP_061705125.1 glutathione S-transferase 1-like [Cydia pomonella]XP_061705126.1 glutathione S-transferase 1-like [Cydia pomonella]